jgi:quinol monooxygenase YgiN
MRLAAAECDPRAEGVAQFGVRLGAACAAEGHAEGDRHQGTLKFEIVVPHDQADRVMLYEVYASPEAFETHWHGPAKQEANRDLEPLRVSVSFVRCDLVE